MLFLSSGSLAELRIKGRKDPEVFAISFGIIDLLMHEDEAQLFGGCSYTATDPRRTMRICI